MISSPISKIELQGRAFFVKRDDLIDPFLAGNKYRKLYTLLNTPKNKYTKIISYGGTQSNAMLAIAAMCSKKEWEFIYYTKTISKTQAMQKHGNFYNALSLGMKHIEIEEEFYKDYISSLRLNMDDKTFVIDQGGADISAKGGLEVLAKEIRKMNPKHYSLDTPSGTGNKLLDVKSVATPSGTGTTALYMALALPEYKVYTTPCIGDAKYLREQMSALHEIPKNLIILEPAKKYHFAKPYLEYLEIYIKLLEQGIEFDLLYAPGMWKTILEQTEEEILYIHSGGVSGNESMLKRYEQKGLYKPSTQ